MHCPCAPFALWHTSVAGRSGGVALFAEQFPASDPGGEFRAADAQYSGDREALRQAAARCDRVRTYRALAFLLNSTSPLGCQATGLTLVVVSLEEMDREFHSLRILIVEGQRWFVRV